MTAVVVVQLLLGQCSCVSLRDSLLELNIVVRFLSAALSSIGDGDLGLPSPTRFCAPARLWLN